MTAKRILIPFTMFSAATMTGTATRISPITDVRNLDNLGIQLSWTGTAVGSLVIQGSNDDITFFDLTFDPPLVQPSNNAQGYGISINQFPWFFIRMKYVNVSGTGTLSATLVGKDLN